MHSVIPTVGQVIEAMREVFIDTEHEPLGGKMLTIEHRPGADVALDGLFVGNCPGLAWANVLRLYRTDSFPAESDSVTPCRGTKAAIIQVGAARCVATVDRHGRPPSAAAMEHDALVGLDDAHRLEVALCRAAKRCEDLGLVNGATWSAVEPIGPSGGALAWVSSMTVQLA